MTGRERRLLRMLCMTASGGGGDKPWDEMTWDDVIAATKNGKYKDFEIGAMKELDLGPEGIVHMQIAGIDEDDLADGSGKAPLTFISKEASLLYSIWNPQLSPSSAPYDVGTGTIGGWEMSEFRKFMKETVTPLIPENVRNAIKTVVKYSNIFNASGEKVNDSVTYDTVWTPSYLEVFGTARSAETLGPFYSGVFTSDASRKKTLPGTGEIANWSLRTAYDTNRCMYVYKDDGKLYPAGVSTTKRFALGFCL